MKNILIVFGTRPEAIKMAPVVKALQACNEEFALKVCVTAQHRYMLDQVLSFFEIVPDYDLDLMLRKPDLYQLTADVLLKMKDVLEDSRPDYVLVHGDTTTSVSVALAAYYMQIPVAHVEAGLRTYNRYAPFPEEINRQLTARIATIHFAPTTAAKNNLLQEGISGEHILVTGNTVIDALYQARERMKNYYDDEIDNLSQLLEDDRKIILVTAHRRENHGKGVLDICGALREIALREDVCIVFPVHLNPVVQAPVFELLGDLPNVKLLPPLGYPAFTWLMLRAFFIITDSGGIQEEAPALGKPVLVMRDVSERPEAIETGMVKLVGTNAGTIITESINLLDNPSEYQKMASGRNPYGDGESANRILHYLLNH